MKHERDREKQCDPPARLILLGDTEPEKFISVREMFEQMAEREGEMIREARERAMQRLGSAHLR